MYIRGDTVEVEARFRARGMLSELTSAAAMEI